MQAAGLAFDGDTGTRWESDFSAQWVYVNLGSNQMVNKVTLNWETASAKAYQIQISTDAANWTTVHDEPNGKGEIETISFAPVTAQYVRMYRTQRNTQYGYSLWEFGIF